MLPVFRKVLAREQEHLTGRRVVCEQPEQCTASGWVAVNQGVVEQEGRAFRREEGLQVGQAHGQVELVAGPCREFIKLQGRALLGGPHLEAFAARPHVCVAVARGLRQVAADEVREMPPREVRHGAAAGGVQEGPDLRVHPEALLPVLELPLHASELFLHVRPLVLQVRLCGRMHLEARAFLLLGGEGRVELGKASLEANPVLRGELEVLRVRDGLLREAA